MSSRPAVSIVVPARNEASRLPDTITRVQKFLDDGQGAELVVAADVGSADDTVGIAERAASGDSRIRVAYVHSKGKGHAVITGMEAARGGVAMMADADLAVDPSQFHRLVDPAREGAIAIASRSVKDAARIGEPLSRYAIGRAFNLVVRTLVLPGIRDSQCGFKAFPREQGIELIRQLRTGGWVFDIELLALARRAGMHVREIPVTWHYGHGSSVRIVGDLPQVARELLDVRRRLGRIR